VPLADVNGARLYYELAGEGPAVTFVHHGIVDSRVWDPQWEVFAERYRVLRYDLRGFGRSSLPGGAYTDVDDLAALLRAVGIERTALVGASMGSRVAFELALTDPDRVDALVIAPPGGYGAGDSEEIHRYAEAEEGALERGDVDAAVAVNVDFWAAGPSRGLADVEPEVARRVAEMQRQAFEIQLPADAAEDPPRPERPFPEDLGDRLAEVRSPTLVIVGDEDASVIRETADRIAAEVAGSEVVELHGAAHVPNLERPEEFNRNALAFLDRVLGPELAH
jgi:pimeloyl-ACP methyl ester carboxylesterase